MVIQPGAVIGSKVAVVCDHMLYNIDKSYKPDLEKGIIDAQEAMGRYTLCDEWGHIGKDCIKTRPPEARGHITPQPGEKMYKSKVKLHHVVTLFKDREPPILDPGAYPNYYSGGTGIRHCNQPKEPPRNATHHENHHHHCCAGNSNINWQDSRDDVTGVNHAFGGSMNEDIKQKILRAIKLLKDAESAIDKVCTFISDCTAFV